MSATETETSEVTETETEETSEQQPQKPTETVEFWKQKAREQEARAKSNAAAAKKLGELEDAQKTEAEKAADKVAKAEAEVASVPSKVAEALKTHLVALHEIDSEDADLFLTAQEPELLLKQVTRLLFQGSDKRRKKQIVAQEGENPTAATNDEATFARDLFGSSG
jgi:hypothetical protein